MGWRVHGSRSRPVLVNRRLYTIVDGCLYTIVDGFCSLDSVHRIARPSARRVRATEATSQSRATNSLVIPQSTLASTIETPNASGRSVVAALAEAPVAAPLGRTDDVPPGEDDDETLDEAEMNPPVALTTCVESEPE